MQPPHTLGPDHILVYNLTYRVLICRECQYAIQKSALQSHLLKHKIYREERQSLLFDIAQLDISEPDQTPIPPSDSPPIDSLPILDGFRCSAEGCGNLCASSKRMKMHWSETHGANERSGFSDYARPAKIQTFFRGTKIRYFEVAGPLDPVVTLGSQHNVLQEVDIFSPRPCSTSSSLSIDLETLAYFHHFVTKTSHSLPIPEVISNLLFWNSTCVDEALRKKHIMNGILAISAFHMATIEEEAETKSLHQERAAVMSADFFADFISEDGSIGNKIMCILNCALWTGTRSELNDGSPEWSALFTHLRKMSIELGTTNHGVGAPASSEMLARASEIVRSRSIESSVYSALAENLGSLPSRMFEVFGRPETTRDVIATLSANALLIECCVAFSANSDGSSAFLCTLAWFSRIPVHFVDMVCERKPAALVLVSFWTSLEKEARCREFWFMRRMMEIIRATVAIELAAQNQTVRDLILH